MNVHSTAETAEELDEIRFFAEQEFEPWDRKARPPMSFPDAEAMAKIHMQRIAMAFHIFYDSKPDLCARVSANTNEFMAFGDDFAESARFFKDMAEVVSGAQFRILSAIACSGAYKDAA